MRFMLKPVALGLLALAVVLTGVVAGMRYDRGIAQWPEPETAPWPTYQHDMQRTGRSEYIGPSSPEVRWSISDMASGYYATAMGPNGLVYAMDLNSVRALTPYGEELWRVKGGSSRLSVALDGTVYFVAAKAGHLNPDPDRPTAQLYALNADGTTKWKYADSRVSGGYLTSPAIAADGTIYISVGPSGIRGEDGLMRRLDDAALQAVAPDGSGRWRFSQKDLRELSSPALGRDGTIYVSGWLHELAPDGVYGDYSTNVLYALMPNGQVKWTFELGLGDHRAHMPVVGDGGTIYAIWGRQLIAVNEDGSEKWRWWAGTSTHRGSAPAIGPDGTIYLGAMVNNPDWVGKDVTGAPAHGGVQHSGKLYALRPDGTELWSFATDGGIEMPPIVDAAGTIYVADSIEYGNSDPAFDDGTVYAVNPDGSERWRFKTGYQIDYGNALVIGHDGTLYVGAEGGGPGVLYALREARGG